MKRHREFEFLAGEYLKQEGFETEVTQGSAFIATVFATLPSSQVIPKPTTIQIP